MAITKIDKLLASAACLPLHNSYDVICGNINEAESFNQKDVSDFASYL